MERLLPTTHGIVAGAAAAIALITGALLHDEAPARWLPLVIPRAVVAPTPAPPAIPTAAVPCVDDTTTLDSDGEHAILCWGTHCRTFDRGLQQDVAPPPERKPLEEAPSVTDANGRFEICAGDDCTRIGPRLTAALQAARTAAAQEQDPATGLDFWASATRDHRVVAFAGPGMPPMRPVHGAQAWDVARDRRLALRPPPSYRGSDPFLVSVRPIGNELFVEWSECAGPCTRAIVVDRTGRNRGPELAGGQLVQQSLDRFLVLGELGELAVIDRGHATSHDASVPEFLGADAVRIDDRRTAVLVPDERGARLLAITDGALDTLAILPRCDDR